MRERSSTVWAAVFFCLGVFLGRAAIAADFQVANRDQVLILTSKLQAIQFLTHATFGSTEAEVDALATRMRAIGTNAAAAEWIDGQMDPIQTPPSQHVARQEQFLADDYVFWSITPTGTINNTHSPSQRNYRQYAWWHNAIAGQDQLRQRTAWALAQIFPVNHDFSSFNDSLLDSTINGGPAKCRYLGISHYYDTFVENAFGKYREILGKVTYHPIMGDWLSYRGNRRVQGGVFPDENYAREVMQLFSIGLDLLSDDGLQQTSGGLVIQNYDADDIREYAQVFTGLGYGYGTYSPGTIGLNPYSPYSAGTSTEPNSSAKYHVPMRMAPSQHDRSTKVLLNNLNITNPNGNNVAHNEASANTDIDTALDGLFNHPSCPPFIVRRLIQRLVKSNPSRAYTNRVVTAFKGTGPSDRGDLKKVIKAILLDPEAWQPIRVQYQRAPINKFVVTTMGTEDSRLQEPVLNYTRLTRFFKGRGEYQRATVGDFTNPVILKNEFRLNSRQTEFAQSPYEMPSVFNFYLPDYQTGELVDYIPSSRIPNGRVAGPEFKIVNAITANNSGNFFRSRVNSGLRTETVLFLNSETSNGNSVVTKVLESTRTRVFYDFSVEQGLSISPTGIESLLERLDLHLCGGTLSNEYKTILRTALLQEITVAGGVGNISTTEALAIARGAILCMVTSPSFLVTE